MKIKLTITQLLKVLEEEKPKFPITLIMRGMQEEDIRRLIPLLQGEQKNF